MFATLLLFAALLPLVDGSPGHASACTLELRGDGVRVSVGRGAHAGALHLRLGALGRGERIAATGLAVTRLGPGSVSLLREGIEERYELCADGVEQSFVLPVLPPGHGDLVLRVAVETELRGRLVRPDAVVFDSAHAPASARVSISGLLAIDADGARAAGSMAWSPGTLELRIPADFLRRARLPLVVDPLISGELTVSSFRRDPSAPAELDVAYLPDVDRFLAVWTGQDGPKGGSYLVSGRSLGGDGVPVGAARPLTPATTYSFGGRVASMRPTQRFLVGSIGAVFGGDNPWISEIGPQGVVHRHVRLSFLGVDSLDVGGEATPQGGHALVVATDFVDRGVTLYLVDATTLAAASTLALTPPGSGDREVAISPSGGTSGRYLVAWTRTAGAEEDVWGAVVSRDGTVLVPPFALAAASGLGERDPQVDGDADHWVVAYERGEGQDHDVACRRIDYVASGGGVVVSGERVVEGDVGQEERDPALAWTGESSVVAWAEQFSGADYDVYLKGVESFGCLDCEGELLVAAPSTPDEAPACASKRSAGGTGDDALLLWMTTVVGPEPRGIVHGRLYRAQDGVLADLGGGCGAGGEARATCARAGTSAFGLALDGAAPLEPCGLFLGVERLDLACGPCTLVLDPLLARTATTDAAGSARFTFPLPHGVSTAGSVFLAQWLVRSPSGCGGFSFSNALEVRVE